MQKHDKMVALAKEKSAEMTETAITAIESMYGKNEKIYGQERIATLIQKKLEEIQVKYSQEKNGTHLKLYEQL